MREGDREVACREPAELGGSGDGKGTGYPAGEVGGHLSLSLPMPSANLTGPLPQPFLEVCIRRSGERGERISQRQQVSLLSG